MPRRQEGGETTSSLHLPDDSGYEEVRVPVPWGHVAGKWWGPRDARHVVVGLHGYDENAGTFDRLAPLLLRRPDGLGGGAAPAFFAWDAPGHGRSSPRPAGAAYTFHADLDALLRVFEHFGWRHAPVVAHSFGCAFAALLAAAHPDRVAALAFLDCGWTFFPLVQGVAADMKGVPLLRRKLQDVRRADDIDEKGAGDVKTVDAFAEDYSRRAGDPDLRLHAHHLFERAWTPLSPSESAAPSTPAGLLYSMTRDARFRHCLTRYETPDADAMRLCAEHVRCHVLSVLADEGRPLTAVGRHKAWADDLADCEERLRRSAASFTRTVVAGTHHVHLNHPERVAPHVNDFLAHVLREERRGKDEGTTSCHL